MIDRGELAAVRVGQRRVRVRQSDLDAFLEASTRPSQAAEPDPADAPRDRLRDALAESSASLDEDPCELAQALDRLADAAADLAAAIRQQS